MKNAIAKSKKISNAMLEQLLKEISNNNSDAFHELYELVKSPIYGYSLSILKNHEEALDNMQDVFIKIYESLDTYKYQNKTINWIFTITRNLALMKLRKQQRNSYEQIDENLLVSSNINAEDTIIIKSLMEKLNDDEREIIIMHLIGNLKYIEISEILNLKLSTTLSKYHRAIKKLKLEWSELSL